MIGELSTAQFWLDLLEIIGINVLLSGDNAVVIALASRSLPEAQRKTAIIGGSAAAVVLRIIFCLVIVSLMQVPYLKLIGGLLLLYIGVKLVIAEEEASAETIDAKSHVWGAIQTILIADAVMSLDNVVAIAAAARGSIVLITLGLLISIPMIVFGSQLLLKVLNRYPILVIFGGGLLGWLAGEIIVSDPVVHGHLPFNGHLLAQSARPVLAIAVMASGMLMSKKSSAHESAS